MTASLQGIRAACFYPWISFDSTGAWSRFSCLWRFLHGEGADVTLAFMERRKNLRMRGLSLNYLGEDNAIKDAGAFAAAAAISKSRSEMQHYSTTELTFLLMYEKGLYLHNPRVGPWLDEIVAAHDIVTCEYPMYVPLLSAYCKKHRKPLIATSLDMLFELHSSHPGAKERLKQSEVRALGLADARVFCNERERQAFAALGVDGVTVQNTGDALAVTPGEEEASRDIMAAALKIATPRYCLFVGSAHDPNLAAAAEVRQMAKQMPEMTFVVAGRCHAKTTEGNFIATGPTTERQLDLLHRGAFAVLAPLTRGTGMSVKIFQAFAYEKAVVSTPMGARGYDVIDGREILLVPTPADFPAALRRLETEGGLRRQIALTARAHALSLDFRTHFQPYRDIVLRLTGRVPAVAASPSSVRSLVLVDNNLIDRVGHHFNYALSLKAPCAALGRGFAALVKRGASPDVLAELSASAVFSQGIHEDHPRNPFPVDWGSIRSSYDLLRSCADFAQELEAGLEGQPSPGDLVFLPNATPRQILGLALLLHSQPAYQMLRFVLLLRYTVYTAFGPLTQRKAGLDKETADRYAMSVDRLLNAAAIGSVRLATDSEELAKEYRSLLRAPVEVLPIPHTAPLPAASLPPGIPSKAAGRRRAVYLGDAREEKGFELLPAAIRACAGSALGSTVEFVFQAFISSRFHNKMVTTIDALGQAKSPHIHLIREPLSSAAYGALLESADLVLLPYDAVTYRARTSGPFVEAICAGKPVVAPGDSWMSAQLGASNAGTTFASGNAEDFGRAVLAALGNLSQLAAAAEKLGAQFRQYHTPENFVRRLILNA